MEVSGKVGLRNRPRSHKAVGFREREAASCCSTAPAKYGPICPITPHSRGTGNRTLARVGAGLLPGGDAPERVAEPIGAFGGCWGSPSGREPGAEPREAGREYKVKAPRRGRSRASSKTCSCVKSFTRDKTERGGADVPVVLCCLQGLLFVLYLELSFWMLRYGNLPLTVASGAFPVSSLRLFKRYPFKE